MRAAPAFQVSLQRFGVWRGAVGLLTALALAALAAWLALQPPPLGVMTWLGAALAAAATIWCAVSVSRQRPVDLRWDGRNWALGAAAAEPITGELSVALDLGAWMLLRFTPTASAAVIWLPVQRRGLEARWHALRCAVHGARPARPDDAALGGER